MPLIHRLRQYLYSRRLRRQGSKLNGTIQGYNFFRGNYRGLLCGKSIWVEAGAKFNVGIDASLVIGDYFYINAYSIIDCQKSITIGTRVQIGPHSYIGDFDHTVSVNTREPFHRGEKKSFVKIGDNVWVGAGVSILKGVSIGKNSVIGAGSVVTRDIPANAIAVGNPARVIKIIDGNIDDDSL